MVEQTEAVQVELLGKDVVWGGVLIFEVGMRLLEPLGVSVLVKLLAFSSEFSRAISTGSSPILLFCLSESHVLGELLRSGPVVLVVAQVDEQIYNLFFSLSPGSIVVHEKDK